MWSKQAEFGDRRRRKFLYLIWKNLVTFSRFSARPWKCQRFVEAADFENDQGDVVDGGTAAPGGDTIDDFLHPSQGQEV